MRKAFRIGLFCLTAALLMPATPVYAQCTSPAGSEGDIVFNDTYKVAQYCDNAGWVAMVSPETPPDCPNIGDVCADGTVYAGLSPDGNVKMYTTASDLGTSRWASAGEVTGFTSNTDGDSNTVGLSTFPSAVTYDASDTCYNSTANGRSDWYLPARDELLVLYTNRVAIGNFNLTANYWSSSENTSNNAREVNFASGATTNLNKNTNILNIRCVRTKNTDLTEVVPSGLVGHWRLDETSGTLISDSSGNSNFGNMAGGLQGSNSETAIVGDGLRFDGTDDEIEIPASASLEPASAVTTAMWVKADSWGSGSGTQVLIAKQVGTGSTQWRNSYTVTVDAPNLNGYAGHASGMTGLSYDFNPQAGRWYHIAYTFDDATNTHRLFVDGAEVASGTNNFPLGYNSSPVTLGFDYEEETHTTGSFHFGGVMDDVRIYDRALTEAEITEIYNARNGIRYNETANVPEFFDGNKFVPMAQFNDVSNGLVGHWELDETTGTALVDRTGLNADGSLGVLSADQISIPGAIGRGLYFNGITNYGFLPATVCDVFDGGGTQSFWVRPEPGAELIMTGSVNLRSRTGSAGELGLWIIKRFSTTEGVWRTSDTTPDIAEGQWNHVVIVYDDSSDSNDPVVYINGVLVTIPEFQAPVGSREAGCESNPTFELGYDFDPDLTMRGGLDDIRFYNRELSYEEVQTLYAMGAPLGQNTALPQGCPNIGDVCDDGTIYAGISPDGSVEMFTTPEDAGLMYWNNDNTNYTDASAVSGSSSAGMSNTSGLVITDSDSVAAGFQTHFAAQYCYDLVVGGSDDWYLPAPDELVVLYNGRTAIGNFDVSGEEYWSSRSAGLNSGSTVYFNNGNINGSDKHVEERVRCVRKGPAPRCANPYGLEGSMFYNTTHDVMQYCDGARWVAIGKQN